MQETILTWLDESRQFAVLLSLLISILIAIPGIVPRMMMTAANIMYFGFWMGTLLTIVGETLGCIVSFWLYRKGVKKWSDSAFDRYPRIKAAIGTEGKKAFWTFFTLRSIPFTTSGLITLAGSIGNISLRTFAFATLAGKSISVTLEGFAFQGFFTASPTIKVTLILAVFCLVGCLWLWRKKRKT